MRLAAALAGLAIAAIGVWSSRALPPGSGRWWALAGVPLGALVVATGSRPCTVAVVANGALVLYPHARMRRTERFEMADVASVVDHTYWNGAQALTIGLVDGTTRLVPIGVVCSAARLRRFAGELRR